MQAPPDRPRPSLDRVIDTDAFLTASIVFVVAWGGSTLLVHHLAGRPEGLVPVVLAGLAAVLAVWTFVALRRALRRLQAAERVPAARELVADHHKKAG